MSTVETQTRASAQVTQWLETLDATLTSGDVDAAVALFGEECYWRDLVAFTWNLHTAEGRDAVRDLLEATLQATGPSGWALQDEATEADGVTEGWITFQTGAAEGLGYVRLTDGLAWTLLTTAQQLRDHPERKGQTRPKGVEHGAFRDRQSWLERREEEAATLGYDTQPYVVIVGGGQGGIGLAARLRRNAVPTIVVERNARPGDSWRQRYRSLCLHDPIWYDHLPYLPFPSDWPVFSPKDKIGDWLESYTKIMELNYWGSTACTSANYDEAAGEWTVEVEREGQPVTLRPQHLVLATGMSAVPNVPEFPGAESFEGDLHHSSQHPDGARYAGKQAVVIGSNNSAHDICGDLWEHGADVTMVQRTSTHIIRSETLMELVLGGLYSEDAVEAGITHDTADLIFASIPYAVLPSIHQPVFAEAAERDGELLKRLEDRGFLLDCGDDDSGLFLKYLRRASGYYIDVGASELVASGEVKLRSGVSVERINPRSVTLSDGSELPADVIVLATGYSSMNGWAAQLISQEVADKVGKVWGLGSDTTKDPGPWEGELRNMWKPTQQEGLWFHGGNLHQSRHYSQFLALQLKARMEGTPTPVYGLPEVHHLS